MINHEIIYMDENLLADRSHLYRTSFSTNSSLRRLLCMANSMLNESISFYCS